jgi:glutamate/aspartate transport system substrate-binding protein
MHAARRLSVLLRLSLASAALAALPAVAGTTILRVMAQESVPPKWLVNGQTAQGVCPDILAAIARAEPRLQFTGMADVRSIPRIEEGLASGQVSVACALLDTPRRQAIASIAGKPLYMVRHRVLAAAGDAASVGNLDDLARLHALVNTPRGSSYADQLRARGIAVDDSTGDNVINMKKVLAGHGRFTYMNELSLAWLMHTEHLETQLRVLPAVFKEEPIYFWVSRKVDPALVQLLDKTLATLAAQGELARIYERWAQMREPARATPAPGA